MNRIQQRVKTAEMADQQGNNNDFLAEYRRRQQERWAQEQQAANASNTQQEQKAPSLVQEEINSAPQQQPGLNNNESLDELRQQFAERFRAAVPEDPILIEDDNDLKEIDKFWSDEQVKIQQEKADEEYARKLQEEFDAEMAEAVQADENQASVQQDTVRPPQEPFVDRLVDNDVHHVPIAHQQQQFNHNFARQQQQDRDDDVIVVQHHNRARPQQQVFNQNQQDQYLFAQQQQAATPQSNSYQVYEQVTQSYNQHGEPIRIRRVVKNHNGTVTSQEFIEPIAGVQQQYRGPFIQQQQQFYTNAPQHGLVQQQSQQQVMGNLFENDEGFFNTTSTGIDPMLRRMQRRMNQMAQSSRRHFSSLFNM